MIKYFFSVVLAVISTTLLAQSDKDKANSILANLVTEKAVMGVVGGYSLNDTIQWQGAFGLLDEENEVPFTLDTKVRMASIAKSMTAVAVMQLVEQGLIELDAPIQQYIPDFPKQEITQITTRHLLSHTSGIGGYKNGKEAETREEFATLAAAVELFKERKLLFEPGTKYSYTTYGYTVLGLLIEHVSGLKFSDYMQQNIWDKAQMNSTGVDIFEEWLPNQSKLYYRAKEGKIKEGKENNLSNRIPGGGFYTTLGDMLKFGDCILNNIFVAEETMDLMRQHHSLEKEKNGYGFGWFLYNPKPNEGEIIGHSGEQTGASGQLFIIPSKKTVVVVLSNTALSSSKVSQAAGNLYGISKKNFKE